MPTLNTIIRELKDIPANRLEEIYQFIHSLSVKTKHSENLRKKILSFGGAFSDLSQEDYDDFLNHTKQERARLFDHQQTSAYYQQYRSLCSNCQS